MLWVRTLVLSTYLKSTKCVCLLSLLHLRTSMCCSLKEHSTLIVFTGWSHFFIHMCDWQMRVCILIISWRNITDFIFSCIKSFFNFLHTWILQDRVNYDEPNLGVCHCFVNLLLSIFISSERSLETVTFLLPLCLSRQKCSLDEHMIGKKKLDY